MLQKLASFSLSSSYQCKLRKNVAILSNLRLNEQIPREDDPKAYYPTPVVKVRRRCSTIKCKNRTTDTCPKCDNQCVGGVLAKKNVNFVSKCTAVNN